MAWSMPTSGQWNSGVPIVANANSMGSYTQEQWSVMQQQQNWQWAQWQQQYGQWPNQYGDEYAQQMQAMQMVGMAGMPPLPPANAAVPPAPPPPDHPPPPLPHENNQPLYGQSQAKQPPPPAPVQAAHTIARAPVQASHTPAYAPRTPVPAPVPAPPKGDPTNDNYGNYNYVNQQGNNQTRAHQPNSFNNNTSTVPAKGKADEKDELSEEEILFDIQFKKWEEEIEKWRKDNVNHPDKRSYMEYEERFKTCRDQLMERRKQMKLKRDLKLANKSANNLGPNTDNKTSATIGSNSAMTSANTRIPTITTIPTNATLNQHKPPSQSYNKPPISYSENNSQYQQFNNRQHGQGYNNKNNISIDTSQPVNKYDALNNDATNMYPSQMEPLNSTNFLPTSASTKEIPGLDLVPSDNPSLPQQEVIDITEDQNNAEHPKFPQGPDYSTISKGISNILGDEKIMNILSMVRVGQNEPNRNPPQKNAPNNQWDNRQQSQENQQHYGNRQQPYNNRQSQMQEPSDQFQNQYYNNSQDYYNDNSQYGNNQNMPPKPIQPPYQNMPPRQGSSNFNNQNTNAPPRLLDLKFNDQIVNRQPTATGGQYGDRQFGDPNSNSGGRPQFNGQNMAALTSRPPPFANQNMPPRGPPHLNRPLDMDQDNSYGRDPHTGIAHEPPKPKPAWVEEPLFTPSIIVEYDHKPLRLKARDFIEPVHMFDYNHTSKDEGTKKKDFDKEVDGLFPELEQENNHRAQFDRPAWEHGRSYPLEEFRQRGPPRDPYDDRRRPDDRYDDRDRHRREDRDRDRDYHRDRHREARDDLFGTRRDDRKGEEFRRGEDFRRSEDLRRGEDFRREEEFRRGEDFRRGDDFRRGEDFRRAEDIRRGDDLRKGDSRRDDLRRDDHRREDSRRDSYKRDDSRKRSISHDRESRKRGKSRESETSATSVVKSEAADTPAPRHVVMIDDILEPPGREMRPDKIVIILRGLPGSGKSYLAKLIRDKEAEFGSTARIMSIDDYFMQEGEVEEKDPATGKMVKKPTLKYEYDEKSEEVYVTCLKRAFKRSLTDGYFNFLIYDAVNDQLKSYADIWNFARQQGFQVYVCTLELDAKACHKRNIHNRTLEEIEVITARFFPTPAHHIQIDPTTLLQNAAIPDVQMEDAMDDVIMLDDDAEDEVENSFTSKWEKMDDATKLARLDGTSKPLRPSQLSMEDYLQLDDWKPTSAKPGKKTVRWADLEERNKQEKMRAIGFVVGQTDWNRMTDPTMGSSALTQTKYIERVRRN